MIVFDTAPGPVRVRSNEARIPPRRSAARNARPRGPSGSTGRGGAVYAGSIAPPRGPYRDAPAREVDPVVFRHWPGLRVMVLARAASAAAALGAAGCFNSGIQPRSADLVGQGQFGGGGTWTVATYAPGTFELANGGTEDGNSGQRGLAHPMAYIAEVYLNTQLAGRVGLHDRVELGVAAGFQQVGGEIRTAVLDEDVGHPVSLAIGAAGMVRPVTELASPWLALTVDVSRRFDSVGPLLDLGVSLGPERHVIGFDGGPECAGFSGPACGEYAPPRHLIAVRRELRLHAALGLVAYVVEEREHDEFVSFFADDYATVHERERRSVWTGPMVTIALVPYVTLWSEDAVFACEGCGVPPPVGFREVFGASFVLGLHLATPPGESER